MTDDRLSIVQEQITQAEWERREAIKRAEDYKKKAEYQEAKAQELEGALRFLRDYLAKLGGEPVEKRTVTTGTVQHRTVGIRSLTQEFLKTAGEFSFTDLYDYISQHIDAPNERSVRAEISFSKGNGLIETVAQNLYRSLADGMKTVPAPKESLMSLVNDDEEEDEFASEE